MAVCLAGGLALSGGLQAANPVSKAGPVPAVRRVPAAKQISPGGPAPAASPVPAVNTLSDNPYAAIAVRNIFGLNPPAPPTPPEDPAKDLPKITLTGIQNVFGNLQALFKVGSKPGTATKDQYYTLDQGERQDDIEVVKIDDKKNVVTFNNHGITQEVPLVEAPASGGAAAAPSFGGMNPAMMRGAPGGGPGGFTRFGGGLGGNNGGMPNSNPGSNGGSNGLNGSTGGMNTANSLQSHIYQPPASDMTADETKAIIEIQRAQYQAEGNPIANLLPSTGAEQ